MAISPVKNSPMFLMRSVDTGDSSYATRTGLSTVMPGLGPGIHAFLLSKQDVDGRDKPGHDVDGMTNCKNSQCLCAADAFSNAAFFSGDASF